jgi:hypothetical protein
MPSLSLDVILLRAQRMRDDHEDEENGCRDPRCGELAEARFIISCAESMREHYKMVEATMDKHYSTPDDTEITKGCV